NAAELVEWKGAGAAWRCRPKPNRRLSTFPTASVSPLAACHAPRWCVVARWRQGRNAAYLRSEACCQPAEKCQQWFRSARVSANISSRRSFEKLILLQLLETAMPRELLPQSRPNAVRRAKARHTTTIRPVRLLSVWSQTRI